MPRKKADPSQSRTAAQAAWEFRLYIAGHTPKSVEAVTNLKQICDRHLAGKYTIQIVDLATTPQLGREDHILAIPTLVRRHPQPVKKIIGDLSDTDGVLVGLDIGAVS